MPPHARVARTTPAFGTTRDPAAAELGASTDNTSTFGARRSALGARRSALRGGGVGVEVAVSGRSILAAEHLGFDAANVLASARNGVALAARSTHGKVRQWRGVMLGELPLTGEQPPGVPTEVAGLATCFLGLLIRWCPDSFGACT
jgi:hypothetical protein